jgi:NarL family two-component system response regulator YdfI
VDINARIRLLLYTEEPFIAEGVSAVLKNRTDFKLAASCATLPGVLEYLKTCRPEIVLACLPARLDLGDLRELRRANPRAKVVLWGHAIPTEFAFQAMQLGVRGILPTATPIDVFLLSLLNVHKGLLCFDQDLMQSVLTQARVDLTTREGQLVMLVSRGWKNKDIAYALGITEGTVKFYLCRLFKKLGMNNRMEMALYGMRNLASEPFALATPPDRAQPVSAGRLPAGPRSLPLQSWERPRLSVVN